MIKIADLGRTFGMQTGTIFRPWMDDVEIDVPQSLEDFYRHAEDYDLAAFGGGGDIHPHMYKHDVRGAYVGDSPSKRDIAEAAAYAVCKQLEIPVLGICRGAQLACVQSGGVLIQHVSGHGVDHPIVDLDTQAVYDMTSMHHQMMFPGPKIPHTVIATMVDNISRTYQGFVKIPSEGFKEPEIIFFPSTHSLAIQGHPEMIHPMDKTVVYVRQLVNKYLLDGRGPNV